MRARSLAGEDEEPWIGQRVAGQLFGRAILAVLLDLLSGHWCLRSIFGILGGRPPKLLVHDAEASGQLVAVGVVVADEKGRLAVGSDKLGDVHGGVVGRDDVVVGMRLMWRGINWRAVPQPCQANRNIRS